MAATSAREKHASLSGDRAMVVTRIFDAPRELVWEVWTNPKHTEKWWGPNGFTTTTHEHDLRPGGIWRHTMHGPDGVDYPNCTEFLVVEKPSRLVYRHGGHREGGGTPVCFEHTVSFEDLGGKTRVSAHMTFQSPEARDVAVHEYGALEGAEQHFANLAGYLALVDSAGATGKNLVITRAFDAPRELVWKAWTNPEFLKKWWGPTGYTTPHFTVDFRVGGAWHACMRSPKGKDHWVKGQYQEIIEDERIVTTNFCADAAGNRVSPASVGFPPGVPDVMVMTVTFAELKGRTIVTVHKTIPESVAREIGAFEGWNSSLDKLGTALAKG